jgi:predicted RNase H-like nuclease
VLCAGVDGCRGGWVAVVRETGRRARIHTHARFSDLLAHLDRHPGGWVVGVDIPIGLPERSDGGGRTCDRLARGLLGRGRAASVFSPPVRATLGTTDYRAALAASRALGGVGLSKQAFNILSKIAEVDAAVAGLADGRVREVHPELCFFEMGGRRAVLEPKRTPEGKARRVALLEQSGFAGVLDLRIERLGEVELSPGDDDVLDAAAACWTAQRLARGEAVALPAAPGRDGAGREMAMWR